MITRRFAALGAGLGALAVAVGSRAAAQSRSLEVWSLESPSDTTVVGRALAFVVKTFEAKRPGVELKITSMPWQQLSPTLLRASRARRVPDVAMFYSPDLPVQIDAHTVMPLTQFMQSWPEVKPHRHAAPPPGAGRQRGHLRPTVAGSDVGLGLSGGPAGQGGTPTPAHIDWGPMMAATIATLVPAGLLFTFLQRAFIQGVTGGAVKG